MRKLIAIIIGGASLFFLSIVRINAATPNYATDITETSSIEDDFKSMDNNINGYACHAPSDPNDYFSTEKNTVTLVDFTVIKLDEEQAQIYLYVYCPLKYDATDYVENFFVSFDIENYEFENTWDHQNFNSRKIAYDDVHGIYKLRCNKFNFSDSNKITITSINGAMSMFDNRIICYPNMTKEYVFKETLLPITPTPPADRISKSTSIADDFRNMNMDIEDYYISKNYNYSKWYVVAMSFDIGEDNKIQSYIYIYNPKQTAASTFEITYKINNSITTDYFGLLKIDASRGLYKIEGFVMNYKENMTSNISISNVISSGVNSSSEFELEARFNRNSDTEISIQSKFDSTVIIEECTVVEVEIHQDDNIINNWNTFWGGKDVRVLAYFYNFNFPEHIKYESVEYAKFQYNYLTYYEELNILGGVEYQELKNKESVSSEYTISSRTVRVNNNSQELNFPTFYLGNRIRDKQFGTLKITGDITEKSFDYDCSVFLDTTYSIKTNHSWSIIGANIEKKRDYTTLDKVEMLELHYKNDGVLYKCQVVSNPINNGDFEKGVAVSSESAWTRFCKWFMDNFPLSALIVVGVPVLIIILAIFCPQVLGLMIKGIVTAIQTFFSIFIKLLQGIISILTLPFRLFASLFKKRE